MSREERLRKLLQHPRIWRPGNIPAVGRSTLATGFCTLDRQLGGGWPLGALTEILYSQEGIGELRLLLPALALLSTTTPPAADERARWLAWVAPPYIPYAPALCRHGVNLARILVVSPSQQADTLWAAEQALGSSACIAVFTWLGHSDARSLRRLQLAAEVNHCWAVVLRPARFIRQHSPAALRVHLQTSADQLELEIIRNRYGSSGSLTVQC